MAKSLPRIAKELESVNAGLGTLFKEHVLSIWDKDLEQTRALYLGLLEQLLAFNRQRARTRTALKTFAEDWGRERMDGMEKTGVSFIDARPRECAAERKAAQAEARHVASASQPQNTTDSSAALHPSFDGSSRSSDASAMAWDNAGEGNSSSWDANSDSSTTFSDAVKTEVDGPVGQLRVATRGRYVVGRELGHGGSAAVYSALRIDSGARCAVKVFKRAHRGRPGLGGKHLQWKGTKTDEGAILQSLSHANIIRSFEKEQVGGHEWIILERLGPDLEVVVKTRGRLDEHRARALSRDLAAGLEYLHGRGIIHRDLKPANILFADDGATQAKIADFGIAATADADGKTWGFMMGTPPFMAPEVYRGGRYTNRVDVWSMGRTVAYSYVDVAICRSVAYGEVELQVYDGHDEAPWYECQPESDSIGTEDERNAENTGAVGVVGQSFERVGGPTPSAGSTDRAQPN
ncbi:kinase-like protein [Auricularia subglabra TFB-10046 SS5]|nr:kinase-like protein [Auricularia subglabra TFB-10046 SS5]